MNKEIIKNIDGMSLLELKELQTYIKSKIENNNIHSWNSQIAIDEICIDYELKEVLDNNNIHNMEEFKENGLSNIPHSLTDKASWALRMFDFEGLEKQYGKK